jgi:predicted AAA+ superfamily ATPase
MTGSAHPRYLIARLNEALSDTPVVCLLGARQVGKTTLARLADAERTYLNFDDANLLNAARRDPSGFIEALPNKVVLDEIQRVPELFPAIKAAVDRNRMPGRFLLTGSTNLLLLPATQESLGGRMEVINLNPLSEQEKHRSPISLLHRLLENDIKPLINAEQQLVEGVAGAVCMGGYPESNTRMPTRARQWHKQYLDAIIQRDVQDIANIRDGHELQRLMELLAHRTGNLLNINNLANEIALSRATTEKYLGILERLYLIRRLPAWHKNEAKRLIKTPKIHIVDSGLACSLSNLKIEQWNDYRTDFGGVLESFVVQQLICQAGWVDNELRFYHYRDKDQVEVDLVIEQGKKIWGVEVKKSSSIQPKGGAGLSRLAAQVGDAFQGGILLYTGNNYLPLGKENCVAVPMDALWV